ncbi:LysR family transcriptional regulator [Nocardioides sp. R-C-SC26]|uniref:LysR family transcriptional regulator n=1 Tax=Nocardioides sp. R-C-SC26 TaxID=2870414 RepID=UPI001E3CBA7F|nr:LysR family transcriptional regulator [Nocardioides sp. R-C-SC26]
MRIEQLEYLTAVVQHGSLRRASEQLHLSQPALSEALSKLERELGTALLDRHRSGARISAAGRRLYQHIVDVLDAVDRLRVAAGDPSIELRPVRVGTSAGDSGLAAAIAHCRTAHPELRVDVRTLTAAEAERALLDGRIDLALVEHLLDEPPAVERDVEQVQLATSAPVAVLPAAHPLAGRPFLTPDDAARAVLVHPRPGHVLHRLAARILGPRTGHTHHVDDSTGVLTLVARGAGLGILPEHAVAGDPLLLSGTVVARPLGGPQPAVALVIRTRRGTSGHATPSDTVRRALLEQWSAPGPSMAAPPADAAAGIAAELRGTPGEVATS